jgi:tyrosine-protein kinase Etk/Wzc
MTTNQPFTIDVSFLRDRAAQKRIVAIGLAGAVLGLGYGLLAPRWYSAVLTVVPAKAQRSGLSSMLGGELAGLASGFDAPLGGADVARITAVLQSNAVTDAVIEKFDLRTRYRTNGQNRARTALWRHCSVKALPKPNLVQLTCEDKDPAFVQQLLGFFAEHGNQVFRRVGVSSATEEVRFLDQRVAQLRQQADDAAARMREFQERHKIVDLDTQAKAVVSALATLNAQRITKQMELDYSRTFSSGDEATAQQLRSQLSVMTDQLRALEELPSVAEEQTPRSQRRNEKSAGVFPAALEVPKLRAEFEKLYRDRKVAETTLIFALERLEAARATEARDVSTFLVLDPPTLPDRHARPSASRAVALFTFFGFGVAMVFEWLRRIGGVAALRRAVSQDSARRAA